MLCHVSVNDISFLMLGNCGSQSQCRQEHYFCPSGICGYLLTRSVLVCLQTCQTTAVPGAVEEAGAFRSRQHETHHTELAKKGQDAHQGIKNELLKTCPF